MDLQSEEKSERSHCQIEGLIGVTRLPLIIQDWFWSDIGRSSQANGIKGTILDCSLVQSGHLSNRYQDNIPIQNDQSISLCTNSKWIREFRQYENGLETTKSTL